jgi:hypothetical protein
MTRRPITFDEKVEARYVRKSREECWPWEGGLDPEGRPRINERKIIRYIFEKEFGPIPSGYVLWRNDHTESCRPATPCRHRSCVNPHHMRLVSSEGGLYERRKKDDAVEGD